MLLESPQCAHLHSCMPELQVLPQTNSPFACDVAHQSVSRGPCFSAGSSMAPLLVRYDCAAAVPSCCLAWSLGCWASWPASATPSGWRRPCRACAQLGHPNRCASGPCLLCDAFLMRLQHVSSYYMAIDRQGLSCKSRLQLQQDLVTDRLQAEVDTALRPGLWRRLASAPSNMAALLKGYSSLAVSQDEEQTSGTASPYQPESAQIVVITFQGR